jgi:hypothetical protein
MTEYILTRHHSDGKISYSWGPKEKQFDGRLITWNHKWLRREAFKLKEGESKIYLYNPYGDGIVIDKEEKVRDFLIDVYFWFKEDWRYSLESLKRRIVRKWDYFWLPRQEKEELKHMWDGIQIVPMHATMMDAKDVSVRPMDAPLGKLFYTDTKLDKLKQI